MKAWKIALALVIIVIAVILLYPKECGHGYGGFVQLGAVIEREECQCIGLKYANAGDAFGLMQCADCGPTEYCIGIPAGKECFQASAGNESASEKKISCGK